ncbi:MAG: tetratricopeptide repeat protein [Nitrososphaera sp.]|nr:tetratricopeptide repeat protein [Nitrososphaera sp.]
MLLHSSWIIPALGFAALTLAQAGITADAVTAHVDRSVAYYQQGDLKGAIAELRKAVDLSPHDPELHFILGNALYRQGDLHGAASEYRATLERVPSHFEAHMNNGFALYELGEYQEAETEWRTAVQLDPTSPFARAGLALGLYSLGRIEEAKQKYVEALARDKHYGNLKNLRIDIRWKPKNLSVVERLLELVQG